MSRPGRASGSGGGCLERVLPIGAAGDVRPFCAGFMLATEGLADGWGGEAGAALEAELLECLVTFTFEYVDEGDLRLSSVLTLLIMFDGWEGRRLGRVAPVECLFRELSSGRRLKRGPGGGAGSVPSPLRRRSDGRMPYFNVRAGGARGWGPGDDASLDTWLHFEAAAGDAGAEVAGALAGRIRAASRSALAAADRSDFFRCGAARAACALRLAGGDPARARAALRVLGIADPVDLIDLSGAAPGSGELAVELWG